MQEDAEWKREFRGKLETTKRLALVFLVLISFVLSPTFASDYYVDAVNGSDETGDGSQTNPWKKLQFAIDSITGTAENPHTIHLAPGHYGPGGSNDHIRIYVTSFLTIRGQGIQTTFNYLDIGKIDEFSTHDTVVSDLTGQYITIDYHSHTNTISNCILVANQPCLSIYNESSGVVTNSILFECKLGVWIDPLCSVVFNNTVFYNCMSEFRIDPSADVTFDYCRMDTLQPGEGNISNDPMFVDTSTLDFRLRKGSPCIDSGDPSDPVPPGGGTRIDMGCQEYTFTPQLYIDDIDILESTGNHNGIPELNESGSISIKLANGGEDAHNLSASLILSNSDLHVASNPINYPDLPFGVSTWQAGPGVEWYVPVKTGWCLPAVVRMEWNSTGASGAFEIPLNIHSDTVHTDPVNGHDQTGDGSTESPYQTIGTAVRRMVGSRWIPATVHAGEGLYSPSSNGEVYPIYFLDYESISGDGPDETILDNDGQEVSMLISGAHTSISDLHIRSTNEYNHAVLVEFRNCIGTLHNTQQTRVRLEGTTNFLLTTISRYPSEIDAVDNTLHGTFELFGRFNAGIVRNNYFQGGSFCSPALIEFNHCGEAGMLITPKQTDIPMVIRDNEIDFVDDVGSGYCLFENNYVKEGYFSIRSDPRSRFIGNVFNACSLEILEQEEPVHVSHNIILTTWNPPFQPKFIVNYSAANYYNNVVVYMHRNSQYAPVYTAFAAGAFSLDSSMAMFVPLDTVWPNTVWSRNGISYHNLGDSSLCERATYSDLPGCPLPTNLDVEPGIRGSGTITDIGPGTITDDTAAWIPGAYRGLPINPAILHSDRIFRCEDNDETTLYCIGDPSEVASIGDVYFIPDFRLRRMSDGYAYDSPLIDAGNPDPSYHDPDGSRCDIGPWGGPLALTPLPAIPTMPPFTPTPGGSPPPVDSPTPDASHTPSSPTSTPSPWDTPVVSATPTATPESIDYQLILNSEFYHSGDPFGLIRTATNAGSPRPVFEIIVLDVYGSYYFWPEWTPEIQGISSVMPHGTSFIAVLQFTWPAGDVGHADGLRFWGGCVDPGSGNVVSDVVCVGFSY